MVLVNDIARLTTRRPGGVPSSARCASCRPGDRQRGAVGRGQRAGTAADAFDEDDARLLRTVSDQLRRALRQSSTGSCRPRISARPGAGHGARGQDSTPRCTPPIVEWAEAVGRPGCGRRLATCATAPSSTTSARSLFSEASQQRGHSTSTSAGAERHRGRRADPRRSTSCPACGRGSPRARALGRRQLPRRPAGGGGPLGARIVFVCDAFHAMTSDRPYRAAMS